MSFFTIGSNPIDTEALARQLGIPDLGTAATRDVGSGPNDVASGQVVADLSGAVAGKANTADLGTAATKNVGEVGGVASFEAVQEKADSAATGAALASLRGLVPLVSENAGGAEFIGAYGYLNKSLAKVDKGVNASLLCDPSAGDDIQAMANFMSSPHFIAEGATFPLVMAEGLQNVSTYIDVDFRRKLQIAALSAPINSKITGIAFTPVSGTIYEAVVSLNAPLPAYVVVNYSLGCAHVRGDGGATALNGAHIVRAIAADRMSFTCQLRAFGTAPVTVTAMDETPIAGVTPNTCVIPRTCIRVAAAGYDGAAREGFINALFGAHVSLRNLGFSFNGPVGPHDLLFTRGGNLDLQGCVLAGAGDNVVRLAGYGTALLNLCCFGGDLTASDLIVAQQQSRITIIRCSFGSCTGTLISALDAGSSVTASGSNFSGANILFRSTYLSSNIAIATSRIAHGGVGLTLTKGSIEIDALSVIEKCQTPLSIAGVGVIQGNPILQNNIGTQINDLQYYNGGYWTKTTGIPGTPLKVTQSITFGALTAAGTAGDYVDVQVACVGAVLEDIVTASPRSGPGTQKLAFHYWVSAADTITIRCLNLSIATTVAAKVWYFRINRG